MKDKIEELNKYHIWELTKNETKRNCHGLSETEMEDLRVKSSFHFGAISVLSELESIL